MPPSGKKTPVDPLALRVTVVNPPANIAWALQLGRDELVKPTAVSKTHVSFDFTVDVVEDPSTGALRLRGPAVQGRPGERFVYLCIGAYAGQVDAPASGRAKVTLEGISRKLIDRARTKPSGRLEAEFAGTAHDGGPSRATVPLLGKGWRPV